MRHPIAVALNTGLGIASIAAISAATADSQTAQPTEEQNNSRLEEVYVTGSRLPIGSETTVQFAIDGDDLLRHGYVRTEDLLDDLPQVFTAQNSSISNGATGTATVSLRGLGPERSLVLLNGKRLPYGSPLIGGIGADINQIPAGLVEKIDLVTGGLSAVYGSDAIAGTLNVRLKEDFEGVQLNTQAGVYRHRNDNKTLAGYLDDAGFKRPKDTTWDGHTNATSLLMGTNFASGRGNVTAFVSYRDINAVTYSNRDYSACALDFDFEACAGSFTIPEVRIENFDSPDPSEHFDFRVQGNEFVDANGLIYNFAELDYLQRPDEQWNTALFGHFDITDDITVYGELMVSQNQSVAQIAPSGNFFFTDTISCDHPFLSDQQFNALCGQFGLTPDDTQTAYMGARNLAGGPRRDSLEHRSKRYVFGSRGTLAGFLNYDIAHQYSRVKMTSLLQNDMSINSIFNALDAVEDDQGNIVCRSVLDGSDESCVPWNVFSEGAVTQAQLDYLSLDAKTRGYTEQTATTAFFNFNTDHFGLKLPMADSGLFLGAGFEFRQDKLASRLVSNIDRFDVAGAPLPSDVKGSIRTKEYFLEAHIPLVQGHEHAENLAVEGSWRTAEYNTGIDAESYGMGITWSPNDSATVKAAYQRAVRAPNVRELFEPTTFNLAFVGTDPCAGALDENGLTAAGFDLSSCENTGVTSATFGTIRDTPDGTINMVQGGSPILEAETANTYTVGLNLEPVAIDGLNLSLEYYNIEITNAIGRLDPLDAIYGCLESGSSFFCDRIERGNEGGDLWQDGFVLAPNENLAKETRQGIDLHISYRVAMGEIDLTIENNYSRMNSATFQSFAGAQAIECAGVWGGSCNTVLPEARNNLRLIATTAKGHEASVLVRSIGKIEAFDASLGPDLGAVNYIDIHGKLMINNKVSLAAGINNLMDKAPPLAGQFADSGIGGAGNTFATLYDVLGQYLYTGLTVNF